MRRTLICVLLICMLIQLIGCKSKDDRKNVLTERVPEPTSIDKGAEMKEEDTLDDSSSEQEFEDIPPYGITYLKRVPDDYFMDVEESCLGYITSIEERKITMNEVRWITWEDEEWGDHPESEGADAFYILDDSENHIDSTIATECEIMILHNHCYPCYKISYEDFLTYIEMTPWDILWEFEIEQNEVVRIHEKYVP